MGMLASRPTRLSGVPPPPSPRSTAIVDECTPLASTAEGDNIYIYIYIYNIYIYIYIYEHLTYIDRLRVLNADTLEIRRLKALEEVDCFVRKNSNTRGHNFKITKNYLKVTCA